ncbi:MAG: CDP-6-deoxy-delta-3,4-glucoseen reductase [Pseudomonadota bacterium]
MRDNLAVSYKICKSMSSYQVTVQPQGRVFSVQQGETVLDAALRQNVGLPYGCRSGNCGTCEATLLEGEVSYADGTPDGLADPVYDCLPCQALPASDLVIETELVEQAAEIQPSVMPCKVESHQQLSHDVMRLMLKLPENQRLQFLAGQYLDFILPGGEHRAFSIANAPHDDALIELHIRHIEGGKFTDYVFDSMQDKTVLRIEAPLGTFTLHEASSRPILMVGGGTGFAPLKSMIEHAIYSGIKRPITLYWGVRAERDLYLPDLPEEWSRQHDNIRFIPVLSEPDEDWQGRTGFVHAAVMQDISNIGDYDVYMTGPPVMVDAAVSAFEQAGLSREHMFSDSFEYGAQSDAS